MREPSRSPPTGRRRAPRGFTLVELMVTLVISSVVVSAAVSGVLLLSQQTLLLKRRAALESEAKLLTEMFVADLQAVGGGSLRPWSVVTVENDYDGQGSDRLVIAESDESLGECMIAKRPGKGAVLELASNEEDGCCLEHPSVEAWENRIIMAVNGNGTIVKVMRSNNGVAAACKLNFPKGYGGGNADELEKLAGDEADLEGGVITGVNVRKYRLNHATHELIMELDTDGDGELEDHVIADQVYDFQVALGYDTNQDRTVDFDGTGGDEFLYNHADDDWDKGGLAGVRHSQLRMVQVGLIVGEPFQGVTSSAQSLNGPVRTEANTLLRATHGRAFLRNLSLYDQ